MSFFSPGSGKATWIPLKRSRISRIFSPFVPMICLWKRCSMMTSLERSFSCKGMDKMQQCYVHPWSPVCFCLHVRALQRAALVSFISWMSLSWPSWYVHSWSWYQTPHPKEEGGLVQLNAQQFAGRRKFRDISLIEWVLLNCVMALYRCLSREKVQW